MRDEPANHTAPAISGAVTPQTFNDVGIDAEIPPSLPHRPAKRIARESLDMGTMKRQATVPSTLLEPPRKLPRQLQAIATLEHLTSDHLTSDYPTSDHLMRSFAANLLFATESRAKSVSPSPTNLSILILALRSSMAENTTSPNTCTKISLEIMQAAATNLYARHLSILNEALQPCHDPANEPAFLGINNLQEFLDIRQRHGPSSCSAVNQLVEYLQEAVPKIYAEIATRRAQVREAKSAQYREAVVLMLVMRFHRRKYDALAMDL
ncbi:hypothetical protein ACHAQK_012226 [Fusarium lateritium]